MITSPSSIRDGFGKGITKAGIDPDVFVLCADLTESMRLETFQTQYPKQFVECGVAEQNMVGMAAGMALAGKTVFACSFACFSPGRTYDQIRVSVCYQQANVKIIGGHAGISVGEDGATHQILEDIAIMRVLPHMQVFVPADSEEAAAITTTLAKNKGPAYLRLSRATSPIVTNYHNKTFIPGQATVLKSGKDITLLACGLMTAIALETATELQKAGIDVEVINAPSIKPFDAQTLHQSVQKTGLLVSMEEHQIAGGLGSTAAEYLATALPTKQLYIGIEDSFGQSGKAAELFQHYKLDHKHCYQKILAWYQKERPVR